MPIPTNFTVLSRDPETGAEKVLYAPNSEGQLEYHRCLKPQAIMYGNRGGGKSHCGRWDAHVRALAHDGFTYAILRRTYPELERTHIIHIDQEMRSLGGYYNKSERRAYYPNGSTGVFAYCEGEEDALKLLSAEYALMFFDELSTFDWDMFRRLSTSCRVSKNSGLIAMIRGGTNPLGPSAEEILHYFVDRDVDPEDDDSYIADDWVGIKVQAEDNANLDVGQYHKMFGGMSAHVKKAWVEGEFSLENALFDVHPKKRIYDADGKLVKIIPYHFIEDVELSKIVKTCQIYRAYDHGYFPDPAYCLWIAHLGNRYLAFHEQLWWKTIVSDIAKDMRETTENLGIARVVTTYADPTIDINTGADVNTLKDIFELNKVPIDLSVNSREMYASAIHTALKEEAEPDVPRLQIYTQGCPYLAKSLPKQRYDPKHPLRMANSKTDHAAIALAYFLISSGAMEKGTLMGSKSMKPWMKPKSEGRWVLGKENVK
jgi:phage terminase large subunit